MQEREKERETKLSSVPADLNSQPVIPLVQGNETDDDPDTIFIKAVAEIDTQPLRKQRKPLVIPFRDVLQVFLCSSLMLCGLGGMIYLAITYPHTLVILYAVEKPAILTTTLGIPTRTLAPVTLTRGSTAPTTGHGHQDAQAARGTVTFYNGQLQSVNVPGGTLFTGGDGTQIILTQSAVVPALDPTTTPPALGQVRVSAQAVRPGANGNIHAFDINGSCCTASVIVKNLAAFTGGRDARTYKAVGQSDIDSLTSTIQQTLETAFTTAFPVRSGEQAQPTTCHTTTAADHAIDQEAQTVTVKTSKTCSAVVYNSQQLESQATAAFTYTKPAAPYHLVGSVQTTLQSVSPVSVTISGKWAYTFSPDYEQLLAEKIAGDTPAKANTYLLSTGVISSASVPNTLPPSTYITFLVLAG